MYKSIEEINWKVRSGKAVVLTASEVKKLAETESYKTIARKVDIVTTATYGPMCSSGAYINFKQASPPINIKKCTVEGVNLFSGIAAADCYIGATEMSSKHPRYGGANVICDLIEGKSLNFETAGKVSDCYPKDKYSGALTKDMLNDFYLYNPRNLYQNYPAAVNSTEDTKYTYMGMLKPDFGNLNFSTSGELSPLINDPYLRTFGIGTPLWVAGTKGYVVGRGTQNYIETMRNSKGIPLKNAASLAVRCDARNIDSRFIRPVYLKNYGISLYIGIGAAIPILDEDLAQSVIIRNRDIETTVFDYGKADKPEIGRVNYEELFSGCVKLCGKNVHTNALTSVKISHKITEQLKSMILRNQYFLSEPVENFSTHHFSFEEGLCRG